MAVSSGMLDFILEMLAPFGAVARRMFSGAGLYRDGVMFALIADDVLYFRTGEANRADYEAAGMAPFMTSGRRRKAAAMPYHEVPSEVLEDHEAIVEWARKAHAVALGARAAKAKSADKKSRRDRSG